MDSFSFCSGTPRQGEERQTTVTLCPEESENMVLSIAALDAALSQLSLVHSHRLAGDSIRSGLLHCVSNESFCRPSAGLEGSI